VSLDLLIFSSWCYTVALLVFHIDTHACVSWRMLMGPPYVDERLSFADFKLLYIYHQLAFNRDLMDVYNEHITHSGSNPVMTIDQFMVLSNSNFSD
jgi:hypothetical protein